jgi:hypothetical protein
MEAVRTSETSVFFNKIALCSVLGDFHLRASSGLYMVGKLAALYRILKLHCHVRKNPFPVLIPNQITPSQSHSFSGSVLVLSCISSNWSLPGFPTRFVCTYLVSPCFILLCPSSPLWFGDTNSICRSRDSSGSLVSEYGLDDRAIEVRSLAGAKDFSCSLCVQTGSGVHPASCTMGTGGPFLGLKRGRGVTLTTHSHLCRGRK